MEIETRMIIEPGLITFPTYKIYPELDIGELEEIIYYDDEVLEYERGNIKKIGGEKI